MNKKELNEKQFLNFINFFVEAKEGGYQIITRLPKELGFNGIELYDNADDFINSLGNIEELDIKSFYKQNKNGRFYLKIGQSPEIEIELI